MPILATITMVLSAMPQEFRAIYSNARLVSLNNKRGLPFLCGAGR
jgi:hypothetical protein